MENNKKLTWSEAELIDTFNLTKSKFDAPILKYWLDTATTLDEFEERTFDKIIRNAQDLIESWNEEELKMHFIAFILDLANLRDIENFRTYFERSLEAKVEGYFLKVKTDFMIAKGILDLIKTPYFHFQEYKRDKDPYGDPLAQLLQAFLIAQEKNQNDNPLYGCYIVGKLWYFVTMEEKHYCVSKAYDSTDEAELIYIIAVLRHFRKILETHF